LATETDRGEITHPLIGIVERARQQLPGGRFDHRSERASRRGTGARCLVLDRVR